MARLLLSTTTLAVSVVAGFAPAALAETKCETKTQTCADAKLGARLCQITICKDELGNIVFTDVIVIRDGTGPSPGTRKMPRSEIPAATIKQ